MSLREEPREVPSWVLPVGLVLSLVSFAFFGILLTAVDIWFYFVVGVGVPLLVYLGYRLVFAVERVARALERQNE